MSKAVRSYARCPGFESGFDSYFYHWPWTDQHLYKIVRLDKFMKKKTRRLLYHSIKNIDDFCIKYILFEICVYISGLILLPQIPYTVINKLKI